MVQETVQEWALIVDDHPLFCDALELTLKAVSNVQNMSAVGSMEAAIDALQTRSPPALIVLDLNLPDVDGLDGLIKLRSTTRVCPIIVVSSMCDNSIISGSLQAGANGFVPKHSRRAVFQEAIQAISANEVYRPPGYVETSPRGDGQDVVERLASLTRQQSCILELICDGKLNKQIAYELSIAETTVKAHVTAIMRKLDVQSRTQAVLVAQKAKFSNVQSEPTV